jgi:hypothetical protein
MFAACYYIITRCAYARFTFYATKPVPNRRLESAALEDAEDNLSALVAYRGDARAAARNRSPSAYR